MPTHKTTPCATCPWRVSNAEKGGTVIPNFSIEKARALRSTVGPEDGFRKVMACHGSEVGREEPCIGYLAVEGESNLMVRLMACRGEIDMAAIYRDCDRESIKLHPNFKSMLAALESVEEAKQA